MGLADIPSPETLQAVDLIQRLDTWFGSLPANEVKNRKYSAAIDAVAEALRKTRQYLKRRADGGSRQPETENALSDLWHEASSQIRPYDEKLSWLCMVKGHGWADERVWSKPAYRDLPIHLDEMLDRLKKLPPPEDPRTINATPGWFPIAAVIFTGFTIASLLYFLVRPEDIAAGKRVIFDIWMAFCIAASLSFIGGTARAHGRLPWLGASPINFAAVGGVAVFVVVLVILYPIYH